jgi:hypothetical protein
MAKRTGGDPKVGTMTYPYIVTMVLYFLFFHAFVLPYYSTVVVDALASR